MCTYEYINYGEEAEKISCILSRNLIYWKLLVSGLEQIQEAQKLQLGTPRNQGHFHCRSNNKAKI